MPAWLVKVLGQVHELAAKRKLRLTAKAHRERSMLAMALDPEDVRDVLLGLGVRDSAGRKLSRTTGEWLYIFKPHLGNELLYVKLVLRAECIIVSFHEDDGGCDEEEH
jgi:hypothetical protein